MRSPLPFSGQQYEAGDEKPRFPTALEIITGLSQLAIGLYAVLRGQLTEFWGLMALALVITFNRPIRDSLVYFFRKRKREGIARKHFPEFQRYIERFGKFVCPQTNDTLHHIVQSELSRNNTSEFGKFGLPSIHFLEGIWKSLVSRLEREEPTLENLQHYASAFGHLLGSYDNDCVFLVFTKLRQETLPPEVKSSLGHFQQRFSAFVEAYSQFVQDLDKALGSNRLSPTYFSAPKPL